MAKAQSTIFQRTKLCRFHATGSCNQGSACPFAHGEAELHPVPDLSQTKMCPSLISDGRCTDSNCRYAHNKEQLRKRAIIFTKEGYIKNPSPYSLNELAAPECSMADAAQYVKMRYNHKSKTLDLGTLQQSKPWNCTDEVRKTSADNKNYSEQIKGKEQRYSILNIPESPFSRQTTAADGTECFDDEPSTCPWTREISMESCTQEETMNKGNFKKYHLELVHRLDILDQSSEIGVSSEENGSTCGVSSMDEQQPIFKESALQACGGPIFHKTKICKFHLVGMCNRGSQCKYAHDEAELRQLPNLAQTKLCPALKQGMKCQDAMCMYAHSLDELRHIDTVMPQGGVAGDQVSVTEANEDSNEEATSAQESKPPAEVSSVESPSYLTAYLMPKTTQESAIQDKPASKDKGAKEQSSLKGLFHKTKICKFHALGLCSRAETCRFAHEFDDLRPQPDLSCTKICPLLLRTGSCQHVGCKYAHTQDELKELKQVCESNVGSVSPLALGECGTTSPKLLKEIQSLNQLADEGIINVKNTFINVETKPPRLRHVASAPALNFGC